MGIFIVDEAFRCLVVMANCARDFIRKRTLIDVLPPLLTFFKTLQVMVADRDKQSTLAATQSRRILSRLETGVWDLLKRILSFSSWLINLVISSRIPLGQHLSWSP